MVLTARADFYADLMLSPLWGTIQANRVEVTPLGEAGLRRAIMRPAEQAGVAVEAALVERLVADAAGEPGVLPLVQETLVLLWERLERRFLPMRAYEALVLTRDSYSGQPNDERSRPASGDRPPRRRDTGKPDRGAAGDRAADLPAADPVRRRPRRHPPPAAARRAALGRR